MKLEHTLKTKTIENSFRKAYLNIMFSGIWLEALSLTALKQFGLSGPQYNVLTIVNGNNGAMTIAAIQERMLFKASNVSRIVAKLLQKELLSKSGNAHEKRIVDVQITPAGKELLEQITPVINEKEANIICKNLSERDALRLSELLDKMRG